MELKEYQVKALDAFTRWIDALAQAQTQSESSVAVLQKAVPDFLALSEMGNYPKTAWNQLAQGGVIADNNVSYIDRTDEAGRPIPHICFKVPTGGGKTLLAAAALQRLNRQVGLTLWITPTNAIYMQTRAALRNREHPYRQMLEMASGGRVKFMEKDNPLTAADVENYLCVMLVSLPATNRKKNRDFLRMFRDSGQYPTFFPDSDDAFGDVRLLKDYPDLERTSVDGPVKRSLFNVIKMLRPVVILDEAHKAYGKRNQEANEEFARAVSRLNPRLVIELSATPNRGISNLLVDITGVELKNEEMIKLPVQVTSFTNTEWQDTLTQAHDKLEYLDAEARTLQNQEGRYIRPIAVVRVERTGKDQRDGVRIHSEDVRDFLMQNLAVPQNAVAVKSSELDELGRRDLLSVTSPVRWIITKAALMEGWDCPFAYLLVMLDNTQAQRAITQLIGRVMRQPHARRTGRELLDQCYVYCMNTEVDLAVRQVKIGLEQEGLSGLDDSVVGFSEKLERVYVKRRKQYQDKAIFLPLVLHMDGNDWCELDYQQHILSSITWSEIDAPNFENSLPERANQYSAIVDVGAPPIFHDSQEVFVDKSIRIDWFVRRLSDVVPNPWQATRIVQDLMEKLRRSGYTEDEIQDRRSYLAYALRQHVTDSVESLAEQVFQRKLFNGEIRFDLEAGKPSFQLVESYEIALSSDSGLMPGKDGQPVQLNLFEPIYIQHFDSDLERKFARYLDEQEALRWWHRVAVRQRGEYYLRGWKQERIWPDFIAMGSCEIDDEPHVLVFETKGEHLDNKDTDYKRRVLETLQDAYCNYGTMTVRDGPAKGTFRLVFNEQEFPAALAGLQGSHVAKT